MEEVLEEPDEIEAELATIAQRINTDAARALGSANLRRRLLGAYEPAQLADLRRHLGMSIKYY